MAMRMAACGMALLIGAPAAGQTAVYSVRAGGELVHLNLQTGAAGVVGASGVACGSSTTLFHQTYGRPGTLLENVLTGGGPGAHAHEITTLSRWSGQVMGTLAITGLPAGYAIHGMATEVDPTAMLFAILSTDQGADIDLLARIDLSSGACTVIGPTGRRDLEALALSPGSVLYALGRADGGTLCTLSEATGAAAAIGGGGFAGDDRGLAFLPDGRLLACGANLRWVNPATGATTLIGPTGFTDLCGLGAITTCYANCDLGGPPPLLNVNDFACFLARYGAGHPWANCDLSTTTPVLNVNDFVCFMGAFAGAAGCW